jgi:RNA polymerase sigma-70 factor (ECF subfamily)
LTRFPLSRNVVNVVGEADEDLSELARRAAAGDRRAAHALLLKVGPAMLRAVRRVLARRTADVEDVVQEAMQALVDALPGFRGQCTVLHFAWRVAVLTALANRRRLDLRAQWAAESTDGVEIEEAAQAPALPDAALLRGRREALSALLDELPPDQAEVLVLHAAYGFTIEELAGAVGRPLETIRSRLRLAKRTLRDRIDASPDLADVLRVMS